MWNITDEPVTLHARVQWDLHGGRNITGMLKLETNGMVTPSLPAQTSCDHSETPVKSQSEIVTPKFESSVRNGYAIIESVGSYGNTSPTKTS